MINYKNLSGQSNVSQYELGADFIIVKFMTKGKDGCDTYKYTYSSTGRENVEEMKKLALAGQGLNSFIGRVVRKGYEMKW